MREDERLSAVIIDIYDAALDASLWAAVLGKTADFCEAWQAALFWTNAASKSGGDFFEDGRRRYVQLNFDSDLKFDPTTTAQFFAAIRQPIATEDQADRRIVTRDAGGSRDAATGARNIGNATQG